MKLYPINLNLADRKTLVVGGGKVAERKVKTLLKFGADIIVIAPEVTNRLKSLVEKGLINLKQRKYRKTDLNGVSLAFASTNDPAVNHRVTAHARSMGILTNSATQPNDGDFFVPSHITRGDLMLTVSTGGLSPALSKMIRKELEHKYGEEYARLLQLIGKVRRKLHELQLNSRDTTKIFSKILKSPILSFIRVSDYEKVDIELSKILSKLGIKIDD